MGFESLAGREKIANAVFVVRAEGDL